MNTGKVSLVLRNIMLSIFLCLLSASVILQISELNHKSFILSFAVAAIFFAAVIYADKKLSGYVSKINSVNSVKLGILLSCLCFLINLIWILAIRIDPYEDYRCFYDAAADIAAGRQIVNAHYDALFPHILGYSSFLGFFMKLFGSPQLLAPVLNLLLTTISGIIIYAIVLNAADIKSAASAYILWILCPSKGLYNTLPLSEPLYTCMILLFILILIMLSRKLLIQEVKCSYIAALSVFCGILLAAINATRPIAAIPIIAFFIWFLCLRGEHLMNRVLWKKWLCFALGLVIVYPLCGKLWSSHLENLLGEEPSGTPGYSIYVGFNQETYGTYSTADMDEVTSLYKEVGNAPDTQKIMLERAQKRLFSDDTDLGILFLNKLKLFMGHDQSGAFYNQFVMNTQVYKLLLIISNIFYYFLVLLCVLGTLRFFRSRDSSPLSLVPLFVIGLCLAHMMVEVQGRYHYSIIPMLVILSSFSFARIKNTVREEIEI